MSNKSTEGEPMYVESLLSEEDLRRFGRQYTTYSLGKSPTNHTNTFRWRWRMGIGLYTDEIRTINKRLDEVLKTVNR